MDDVVLVGVAEAFGGLRRNFDRLSDREHLALRHDGAKLVTLEQLHRHVGDRARLADVVDGDDVGMV